MAGRIAKKYRRITDHLEIVGIQDAGGCEQTLQTTDEHPFYVPGRSWTKSRLLEAGDPLAGPAEAGSSVTSNARHSHPQGVIVYNMEIEGTHTYFVRAEGSDAEPVWVHNAAYKDIATRTPEEVAKLRAEFESIKPEFIADYASTPHAQARFTLTELAEMAETGRLPQSWYVHHKLPLFRGGNNAPDNFDVLSWEEHYGNGNYKRLHYYEPGENPYGLD